MQAIVNDAAPRRRTLPSGEITVLLVEDDPTVRDLVARVLQREGYAVLKARHGAEALVFSGEYRGSLHLLLTDLGLGPQLGGRQVAEAVRLARPGIPVLYMSGMVDDEEISSEVLRGEASFLPKPFTPSALLDRVAQAAGRPAPVQ